MPEYDAPMDGMLTVSIDGDRITKVSVEQGETISVGLETESEDDDE